MRFRVLDTIAPGLLALLGIVLIMAWLETGTLGDLEIRIPGPDYPNDQRTLNSETTPPPVAGEPIRGDGIPAAIPGDWPWFRGANHDGICRDATPLLRTWPAEGPPALWTITLGEGYASAAIHDGCVFVLDYDEQSQADTMRCLSLDDGREVWRNSYPVLVTRNHGMSRTVPAVVGKSVISFGPRCHVACWDTETGTCRWLIDLVGQYGATVPRWYAGQCPLIDRDQLILAPFGDAMLIALDYETGDILWESPNPRGWKMTHASVVPMEFENYRMYVCCGTGGVAGVGAEDGSLLWDSTEWPEQFATSPSPVPLPGGRIFLSSGYANKTGSLMLQLTKEADSLSTTGAPAPGTSPDVSRIKDPPPFQAELAYRLTPKQFNSEQQTPIYYDGHLFAVRKRGGGQLVCLDLEGNERWNSAGDRFGHGPYMIADGLIYVMDNHGKLAMVEATPSAYNRLGQCVVFEDGYDAWGPMALVAGRLIVRDMTRMTCLDVAAGRDDR
ncbi:MAG: PQQ-binding-like beta-propeller repeat protein [Pirellulales bacterium]|nr:PQQ-binding-like beta-propeller repeat protein [Pirellulales bacterium]